MAKNALMIDPHTGQPVEWSGARVNGLGWNGIDPAYQYLLQKAGLWNPEYGAAAADPGTDPASRSQFRQQWQDSPEYQALSGSLAGWDSGQSRDGYSLTDWLQSPEGQTFGETTTNKGSSLHSNDYRSIAAVLAAAAGGYGLESASAGAGGAAASNPTVWNAALADSAVGTGGYGASSAGLGGGATASWGAGAGYGADAGAMLPDGSFTAPMGDQGSVNVMQTGSGADPTAGMYQEVGGGIVDGNAYGGTQGGGFGSSLGDFFSGNGSVSDYLRAGQFAGGLLAQNKATGAAQAGNNAQAALLGQMYQQNRADNQPLMDVRNSVLPQIQNLLKNPGSITSDPGYQFGLKQGANQLNNRAAASGNYYSGAQMKAQQQYGQDYAGTKLDQSLNRLTTVAGLGQVGANNNQSNNTNFGTAGGNSLQQGGNIRAGGYLGAFSTANNEANNWMQDQYNRKYWGGGG